MGDYTKHGVKIGTCGKAYYATYPQLKKYAKYNNDREVNAYLKPVNGISHAFPFPKYDNKNLGDISQFHSDMKEIYELYLTDAEANPTHNTITHSCTRVYSDHGYNINVFHKCPQDPNIDLNERSIKDSDKGLYTLEYTGWINGKPSLLVYCAYCGSGTHYTLDEGDTNEIIRAIERNIAAYEAGPLQNRDYKKIDYHKEILKRCLKWYKGEYQKDTIPELLLT